jgi:hypothetical protein
MNVSLIHTTPRSLNATWRKSSHSTVEACVEARAVSDAVEVRDSKAPDGPVLRFPARGWSGFLSGVVGDEFRPGAR